ncbi:MAG: hypothetical protein EKK42_34675 [Pseudonocardiaceae bacterium]|nr:MAG: hypothetical protein EKK42_34675 [Pseudonocardiaceae bacterium]
MTLEQAQAEFQAATEAYAAAKRGVSNQRFAARHSMPNTLAFAEMVEYTAYHKWLRAHENVAALQPSPAPKLSAPKAVTATASVEPTPFLATKAVALAMIKPSESFDLLGHLEDRCRESEARVNALYGLAPPTRS